MLPLRLSDIAELVGGNLIGNQDPEVSGVAGLSAAGDGDLSFVADAKHLAKANQTGATALLVGRQMTVDKPCVQVDDPYAAFAQVLAGLQITLDRAFPPGVHETAIIDASADVARATAIGPYCVVGAGVVLNDGVRLGSHVSIGCDVELGPHCVVHAQAVLREGCLLGERVIVHAAAVLGSDGFGYLPGATGMQKIPQVGIVVVGNDVEIGAGVTVDRATTGRTVIGDGTKIDNQVQIAHNVQVGRHCALSAQTGIAGSAVLGDGVICGGQVGVGDHIKIGSGSKVGGQTGVSRDLAPGSRAFGTPVQDIKESFRMTAATRRLPELQATVRELKTKLADLEQRLAAAEAIGPGSQRDQEN
ncbi:MAG: UDP-3-O-(3-hydroxymyristoyl)glucosamine N-acyltransferase [Candidatus Krumholzibacteria bacterium]|nr:UDP-3-O-(3-hydroxymyristoyl)glucosamine N-acyltransferase [Candidatus Krumholzibacteria bacterium]